MDTETKLWHLIFAGESGGASDAIGCCIEACAMSDALQVAYEKWGIPKENIRLSSHPPEEWFPPARRNVQFAPGDTFGKQITC